MAYLAMPRRFELEFWRARSRGLSDKNAPVAAGVSQERDELATHPSVRPTEPAPASALT